MSTITSVHADRVEMRSFQRPHCLLCGAQGRSLYKGLKDRLYGVTGSWGMNQCPGRECGLIWLDPAPVEEDLGVAYQSYYTHRPAVATSRSLRHRLGTAVSMGYLRRSLGYTHGVGPRWYGLLAPLVHLQRGGPEVVAASVAFQGRPGPGGKLLDIGCGNGVLMERMRDLGWEVEGIDFDAGAVAAARDRGLRAHHGRIGEFVLPDASFDLVHLGHVIEHVHEPVDLLRRCHRILKPGGTLVVITPNSGGWGHRHYGPDWRGLEPPRHLAIFNRPTLHWLLAIAGFNGASEVRTLHRGAGYVLTSSAMLRNLGTEGDSGHIGWRLCTNFNQLWGRILGLVGDDLGEELLGVARKN